MLHSSESLYFSTTWLAHGQLISQCVHSSLLSTQRCSFSHMLILTICSPFTLSYSCTVHSTIHLLTRAQLIFHDKHEWAWAGHTPEWACWGQPMTTSRQSHVNHDASVHFWGVRCLTSSTSVICNCTIFLRISLKPLLLNEPFTNVYVLYL